MLKTIDNYLSTLHTAVIVAVSLFFVLVLGVIDLLTGPEISFSVFYTFPVFISTWYGGRVTGITISFFAALTWLTADLSSGHQYTSVFIPAWNSLVRLSFFIVISFLLMVIKRNLETEENLADTDYLTGLKNSRSFHEFLESEALRSKRYNRPFTIALFDLDNFKYVNDTQGHETGDKVLKAVAETIKNNVRHSDVTSRLGGDEFAVLLTETNYEAAGSVLNKFRELTGEVMRENRWPITLSVGMITYSSPMDEVRDMIKAADDLMYKVKKEGKNNLIHMRWPKSVT